MPQVPQRDSNPISKYELPDRRHPADLDFLLVEPISFRLRPSVGRIFDACRIIRFDPCWSIFDDRTRESQPKIEEFYHHMRYKIDELAPYESSSNQPTMPNWHVLHFQYRMGAQAIWAAIPEELMLFKLKWD